MIRVAWYLVEPPIPLSGRYRQKIDFGSESHSNGILWTALLETDLSFERAANTSYFTVLVLMKTKLCKAAIFLEENIARWLSREAARQKTSISSILGAILKERMSDNIGYERTMRRALARKSFLKTDGKYLSRDTAHDRADSR